MLGADASAAAGPVGRTAEAALAVAGLRHIERTRLLLHLVDVSSSSGRDAVQDYEVINRELEAYSMDLAAREQIVVATKIDALDDPERLEALRRRAIADGRTFLAISSVANRGLRELVNELTRRLVDVTGAERELVEIGR